MSRCFISYRHVAPDRDLAHALGASLTRGGHTVFLDTQLEVGTRWVDEIEREIKAADFFAVLLSEHSIRSDMVRAEVAIAHRRSAEAKLCIFPVRVGYSADLPYDLAAYLDPFQHSCWDADEPFDRICSEIETAINHRAGRQTALPCVHFERESLDRVTQELAVFVGPAARILVSRAAKKAQTWKQLYDTLATEVPAGEERKNFLAKRPLR
jgi:hypothetical protein